MVEFVAAYRVLVGVAMGCGLVIAGVFEATREPIQRNRAEALQAAITQVLPASQARQGLMVTAQGTLAETTDPVSQASAYLTRDAAGNVLGFAILAMGMGYQDQIRLLYGYDPAGERLTGYVLLESRETPGLGALIGSQETFLERFRELPVSLDPSARQLANPLTVVVAGSSRHAWEIDGITGATVSSRAVVAILNDSLQHWLPKIKIYEEILYETEH